MPFLDYFYSDTEAARAEEAIPSMTYRTLVSRIDYLAGLGLIVEGNPAAMLVAARLVDRTNIVRSRISSGELRRALDGYRRNRQAAHGIVKALERAIETASENECQAAAHGAG